VAERHWHESQNIEEQNDTSVILRFDLDPTPEFKSWILGLGAAAEVLEPESLRQSIKAELATMLQNCA
jgi:predicted DNA-binding transcriptional regulator YafY